MAKKLITYKFYSKVLLPKDIADKGTEAIEKFENEIPGREGWKFKEGDEVVHKYNLEQKMIVQEIRQKKTVIRGQERIRLDGIICHYWEAESEDTKT